MNVLMLSPEAPYPLWSGGAYRTASLLHYFSARAEVDLAFISETGKPAELPPGLIRSQYAIPLPRHSKNLAARYARNARRAVLAMPPLIDRFSNLENQIETFLAGRHYDLGIIEHFWCAQYIEIMQGRCSTTVLNLHNIESVLHERSAEVSGGLVRAGHMRFAAASRRLEADLLPRFPLVLATSDSDSRMIGSIAPSANAAVYANAFPWVDVPSPTERHMLVFSANFEYHPNVDAVRYLLHEIWPAVRQRHPDLILRLVGRNENAIRTLVPGDPRLSGIEISGPVPDALSEIASANVAVAPLRSGSGTRIKIIEAWAAARPVVATPLAAEGLDITNGENILIAPDVPTFVAAIDSLLSDERLRRSIGAAGRRTFEDSYSWNVAWKRLDLMPQLMPGFGLKRYNWTSDAIRR